MDLPATITGLFPLILAHFANDFDSDSATMPVRKAIYQQEVCLSAVRSSQLFGRLTCVSLLCCP